MIAMLKACKAVGNVLMVSKGRCLHQPGHLDIARVGVVLLLLVDECNLKMV